MKFEFKGIQCGDPTSNLTLLFLKYQSGSPIISLAYPATITLSCVAGYVFDDGFNVKVANCSSTGKWKNLPTCIGIYLLIRKYFCF